MFKWKLSDLPTMITGDILAFEAMGFGKKLVEAIGAKTFHWAMLGTPQAEDEFSGPDWSVAESISSKGVSRTLLSDYRDRNMRVYRPVMPKEDQTLMAESLMKRCTFYGRGCYDWLASTNIGVWFILRHLGLKWWMKKDSKFYCIEFINQVYADFDFPLCDGSEPPNPQNLERTGQLELIWGTF